MSGETILVIPDSHSNPEYHNRRYRWLAYLINDLHPTHVIDIGDWFDMPSLSSYDKGKKSFEGRRYKKDIEAGVEAQQIVWDVTRQTKRKLPKFWRTLGNHENRIIRAVEVDPILEGTIGISDLQSTDYGWEEIPFLDILTVGGVRFSHYFTTGVMNRPVGGKHQAYSLLVEQHTSCVMGHTHVFDECIQHAGDRFIQAAVVGCYQDYDAAWAGPANARWNKGVYVMRNVENGTWDQEWISIKRLREAYISS